MVQCSGPEPAGRLSVRVTDVAVPEPMFEVTIVNTASLPAPTVPAPVASLSGVLTTRTSGQSTVTESLALPVPALVEVKVAVLL